MIVFFFYCWKTPNAESYAHVNVDSWSLQKFLKLIHYIVTFLSCGQLRVTWGAHPCDITINFPELLLRNSSSDSLPGRSFKSAAVSTMWTEVTSRTEHLKQLASRILFLLLFSLVNLNFALAEWTAKSFQSLLLLPWNSWPLVKVSQLQNSAIKRFSG